MPIPANPTYRLYCNDNAESSVIVDTSGNVLAGILTLSSAPSASVRGTIRGPSAATIRWPNGTTGTFGTPSSPSGVNLTFIAD